MNDTTAVLPVAPPTPLDILQSAVERGVDPAQLEKLMDLQERWERNRSAERFGDALAQFQSRCPAVFKRREVNVPGKMQYRFASLDDVMAAAGPVLSDCGIAVSFDTEHDAAANRLTVICRLRVGAYFEDRRFTSPVPADLKVSEPQRYGAALSYLKRYALCAALNIVATDQDDDGASLIECITPDQIKYLNTLIEEKNADLARFLKWAQVESLDKLPRKQFPKAVDMLRRKKGGAA